MGDLMNHIKEVNKLPCLWKEMRKDRIHNRYFSCKQELSETIEDYLKMYSKRNKKFQNLCIFKYVA